MNSLLQRESSPLPYAFYINNIEVVDSLESTLIQIQQSIIEKRKAEKAAAKSNKTKSESLDSAEDFLSFEDAITISYQPLSVFKVRPVTRCVEVRDNS